MIRLSNSYGQNQYIHTYRNFQKSFQHFITFIALTYLCAFQFISLVVSGGIETNPGPKPPKFPCWHCNRACCDYQGIMSGILCESCNTWYHAVCVNIDTDLLSVLERSSCPWECPNCGLQKISATLFDSVILDSDITLTSSEESPCITPLLTQLLSSSPSKNMQPIQSKATNLRIVAINFQIVCAKKKNLGASLTLTRLMSSLVVKRGLCPTLAIMKSFHLAIMST